VTQPHGRAVIDLAALRQNVATLKQRANGPALMAVVKADAYGHGLVPCAKAAVEGGADWLATALLDEAIELRAAGIEVPILAWLNTFDDRFAECISADIDLGINGTSSLAGVVAAAREVGKVARVHVKVDTGLGRNGIWPSDLPELIAELLSAKDAVRVVGVMSHFAYADEPSNPTIAKQIEVFKQSVDQLTNAGFELEVKHLSNSAATLGLPETYFNLIRPGVAIYGISPGGEVATAVEAGLRPVMSLRGAVALVKSVPSGVGVSYAHQYHTPSATRLALIPLGYADGIPRAATNVGPILVAGELRKISGRVCMDQFVVDIDDLPVVAGDEVILFGDPAKGEPSIEDWAIAVNTIPYEIATRLGPRVPREYVN
jgi:alanine racemase